MSEGRGGDGGYVRRIREENRRYAHDLLEENGKLRALVASCQAQQLRLREAEQEARVAAAETEGLRERLQAAEEQRRRLETQLREAQETLERHESERRLLPGQLARIDDDGRRYSDQFLALEQQNNNLANLYVASYRLHGTLDREELIESLSEIISNLVGSEEMALFEVDGSAGLLRLIASNGVQPEAYGAIPLGRGLIGGAAVSGKRRLVAPDDQGREPGEEHLSALIPLVLEGRVFGVLAIFRLLPQKRRFEEVDLEIFELLGAQAAMALYSTALHARLSAGAGGV